MTRKIHALVSVMLLGTITARVASAAEIGHYAPGVINIRDMAIADPGFYFALYNYGYRTSRINDANGNKISSVNVGPGQGVTLGVNVDVGLYAVAPVFMWVSKGKVLGAKYAAYVSPTFTNASLNGLLSSSGGAARSASAGQFRVGDIFVQPIWLSWASKNFEVTYGYGFYIPSGKYTINTYTVPGIGAVRAEAADNTGFGFWTNQNQGALYIYPWADKRLAIQNGVTWEFHQQKRGFDLRPGQNLTHNWGLSQFLPLKKDFSVLAEAGVVGYNSFQVSDDSGSAVRNPTLHDRLHAVGLQAGLTLPKRGMVLNFRYLKEFSAVDRFQGDSIGINFAIKLGKQE